MLASSLLLFLAAAAPPASSTRGGTPPAECHAMEAAFLASQLARVPLSETPLVPNTHEASRLAQFIPGARMRMHVTDAEFQELERAQERQGARTAFVPDCGWKGVSDSSGESGRAISIDRPLMSSDGRLAMVFINVRFQDFGEGKTCVDRRVGDTWTAECHLGWIT